MNASVRVIEQDIAFKEMYKVELIPVKQDIKDNVYYKRIRLKDFKKKEDTRKKYGRSLEWIIINDNHVAKTFNVKCKDFYYYLKELGFKYKMGIGYCIDVNVLDEKIIQDIYTFVRKYKK